MLIWGGRSGATYLQSGALYDPTVPGWTATLEDETTPSPRAGAFAAFYAGRFLVYGGLGVTGPLGDGAWYDPVQSVWTALPTLNAPVARRDACVAWDDATHRLFVWGGKDAGGTALSSGAIYDASVDRWTVPHLNLDQSPVARSVAACAFGGGALAIWGGVDAASTMLSTGSFLTPPAP
jgi:hypothetical protein